MNKTYICGDCGNEEQCSRYEVTRHGFRRRCVACGGPLLLPREVSPAKRTRQTTTSRSLPSKVESGKPTQKVVVRQSPSPKPKKYTLFCSTCGCKQKTTWDNRVCACGGELVSYPDLPFTVRMAGVHKAKAPTIARCCDRCDYTQIECVQGLCECSCGGRLKLEKI